MNLGADLHLHACVHAHAHVHVHAHLAVVSEYEQQHFYQLSSQQK